MTTPQNPTPGGYDLAPRPGQTATQRKGELDAARFVAVRNLAHLIYKKPDGQSLMTYQETLDDREKVKMAIIQHEIALNLLINDLGAAPAVAAPVAPMQAAAVAVMQPTPTQQVPMQPSFAPLAAPQMVPMAPTPVAPVAAPQAVAQVAPAEQAAPAAVTGRARRGRAAGAGVAVAPPPAAAPMVPLAAPAGAMIAPPAPMAPQAAPQAAPAAPTYAPPAFTAPVAAPVPVAQQTAGSGPVNVPVAVDLSPVIERLDHIGQGLSVLVKENEALKATNKLLLVALHHLYSTSPALAQSVQGMNIDQFTGVLAKYAGNPQ